MKKSTLIALFVAAILLIGVHYEGWTQVSISAGATVTENFNSIGGSATATLPTGWKADKLTTVRTLGTYAAAVTATTVVGGNTLSTTAGNGIYNYGAGVAATATDRAVGGLSSSSASKSVNVYSFLVNSGTENITQLSLSYKVEKYRRGSNTAGFSIQMYYSADGITWTSAGPNFLSSFLADADNNGYASAPGDSLAVVSQSLLTTLIPGDSLYLAWNYSVSSGTTSSNAQALGVDDISIVASAVSSVVESPVFAPPAGNYYTAQSITITCNTPDASIYYTTDGSTPTELSNPYTLPIPLSANTTLKAKAFKTGFTESGVTSGIYRFPISVSNIAALRAGVTDGATLYTLTSEAIVTYQRPDNQRNQMYIKDATGAIVVDDLGLTVTNDFNIGDGVTGLTGTLTLFNSLLEFVPTVNPGTPSSTGNAVVPEVRTLASLTSADQAKLVSIPFVSFSTPGNFVASINYPITDASGTGTFRTLFGEADYLVTPTYSNHSAKYGRIGWPGRCSYSGNFQVP
ncbi:MAG: chitobiase/beta-hexosaminidase C-terminal domain-containing protein [Bacteroidales bacterium]|nr:chitobiase/beta-hexosaminidase C-terminal domain-containing protein [Bacteroidales bacterium]